MSLFSCVYQNDRLRNIFSLSWLEYFRRMNILYSIRVFSFDFSSFTFVLSHLSPFHTIILWIWIACINRSEQRKLSVQLQMLEFWFIKMIYNNIHPIQFYLTIKKAAKKKGSTQQFTRSHTGFHRCAFDLCYLHQVFFLCLFLLLSPFVISTLFSFCVPFYFVCVVICYL